MNAYLFTAVATVSQVRPTRGRYGTTDELQTWDAVKNLIVFGDNPDAAQTRFETWSRQQPEGENPVEVEIKKIAAAQFVDQLFTESGNKPIDWPEILKQALADLEATPVDDFEQGYWVDVDQVVAPGQLSFNIEALQQNLPEDIRSGLNWAADKQFLFVLSVLSAPPPPPELADELEPATVVITEAQDENPEEAGPVEPENLQATFPEAADKEAAALIQARNSVIAAWLWRRFAANTPLAANEIRVVPWCGAVGLAS